MELSYLPIDFYTTCTTKNLKGFSVNAHFKTYESIWAELEKQGKEHFEIEEKLHTSNVVAIANNSFFKNTTIKHIKMPKSINYIGQKAYALSTIEEIEIPEACNDIDVFAFASCENLKKVTFLGNNIQEIKPSIFNGCLSLEEICLPKHVTTIETNAFRKCTSLKKVYIPGSVTKIDFYAFDQCGSFTVVSPLTRKEILSKIPMPGNNKKKAINDDLIKDNPLYYAKFEKDLGIVLSDLLKDI